MSRELDRMLGQEIDRLGREDADSEDHLEEQRPCEDAPCCGHGGVCGRGLGMSIESYEDGFDTRTDDEIKQAVYDRLADDLDDDYGEEY